MPLDRLILIVVCVCVAFGTTLGLAVFLRASFELPVIGPVLLIPPAFVAYVVWRIIRDRVGNAEDDHYDRIEK